MPVPIILQQIASRRDSVPPRHHAAADEQIDVPVTVEVTGYDAGTVVAEVRQRILGAMEIPVTVVQVQPVAQRRALPEFVTAAHDVEIEVTVAVGIEEGSIYVFVQTVGAKGGLGRGPETAVRILQEQLTGLPFGAPYVDVVPAIAVDVTDREGRALGREQMGHQRLAAEVEERVLLVLVVDWHSIGDVRKQRRRLGGWADRRLAACFSLRQGDYAVDGQVLQHLIATVGPNDRKRVHMRRLPQTKMSARIDR